MLDGSDLWGCGDGVFCLKETYEFGESAGRLLLLELCVPIYTLSHSPAEGNFFGMMEV